MKFEEKEYRHCVPRTHDLWHTVRASYQLYHMRFPSERAKLLIKVLLQISPLLFCNVLLFNAMVFLPHTLQMAAHAGMIAHLKDYFICPRMRPIFP